jgi:indole-3-glycerol phosphate synthase
MTSYLQDSIARTREQVAKSKVSWPEGALEVSIRDAGAARSFFHALVERHGDSPFRVVGGIRLCDAAHGTEFEPLSMARRYQRAGASALAIIEGVEDDPQATRDAMAAIRSSVPLPLLHHRLVIDPHQIRESRAWGADAVLLVAEALTEGEVIDFQILASELAMTSVLLAHEEWNLLRTIRHVGFPHASGCLIAIDNRDPSTGDVDLTRSVRLAGLVEDRKILLSLHGIRESRDVATLRKCGFHLAMVSTEDGGDPVATTAALLQGR